MFLNADLSTANYDALLIGWSAKCLAMNVSFSGGTTAKINMKSSDGWNWTIIDGNSGETE